MTVTDEDRAKAAELWNKLLCNGGLPGWIALDAIADALAAERAAADKLRADVLALADELVGRVNGLAYRDNEDYVAGLRNGLAQAAGRLLAVAGHQP